MTDLESMKDKLKSMGKRWEEWPRSSPDETKKAEEYYQKEIMPLLIKVFVAQEQPKVEKKYDGMILSLGTSFEPLVLSIMALQPYKICFLYTEQSKKYLDPIIQFTGILPSSYSTREVKKDNPLHIYQAIKDIYQEWGKPTNLAVDFTGGTKAMSGGSAMAGGIVGADMVYIASNNYLKDLRRPFPGSEHLEFIPNPYQVFGDLEAEKGYGLMSQHDFTGAYRIFERLETQVPDPRSYNVLALLCRAYECWDNMDIDAARQHMSELINKIEQYAIYQKDFILQNRLPDLKFQLKTLDIIEKHIKTFGEKSKPKAEVDSQIVLDMLGDQDFVSAMMFTLYCNAMRRKNQGKYDMACLLLYRLLELISQVRLASWGVNASNPDYAKVDLEKLHATLNKSYINYNYKKPFNLINHIKLNLFQSYVILAALGDDLSKTIKLDRLMGQVQARNNNIFAHGFDKIDQGKYNNFHNLVADIFDGFLATRGESIDKTMTRYEFILPK